MNIPFSDIKSDIRSCRKYESLKIHSGLSKTLKTSNKSVWSRVFWYVKVCTFRKCI